MILKLKVALALLLATLIYRDSSTGDMLDNPTKGALKANVTIVEYSDFQCPACAAMYPILNGILKKYPKDVRIIYKNYPLLESHRWAYLAAMAGECAYDRGKFWEYHDLLFKRQDVWSKSSNAIDDFLKYAEELGMEEKEFRACIESASIQERVDADIKDGKKLNINSTPTFFVNGRRYVGAWSAEEFDFIVRGELRIKN